MYENLELPLLIKGIKKEKRKELIQKAIEYVDLTPKIKSLVKNLSGGERQRVAIARALVSDTKYIFADEPCGNLDSINSEKIMNILKGLSKMGKQIILVTHNEDDRKYADRVIYLKDGAIVDALS